MRTFVHAIARLAAIPPVVLIVLSSASAGPLPVAAAVRPAGDGLNAIENVVCYGYGWRGWGV